jgi:hypothetical protein
VVTRFGVAARPDSRSVGAYRDFGLYLHRNPQRQLCHAHRGAGVVTRFETDELQDQIREAVNDVGLPAEARCGVETMPKTLSHATTRFRSPNSRLRLARTERAIRRAAS